VILAIGLAAGAIVALGLTLAASVRRRRRDLALLRALGFTPRQLRAAVAWQATVAAVIGVVMGLPVGIVAGRVLWTQFAHNLDAVPDPTIPVLSMILVALDALVFANLVAALPGRDAARTDPSAKPRQREVGSLSTVRTLSFTSEAPKSSFTPPPTEGPTADAEIELGFGL
jgi:ABC-type lipoprotein release transport system permease subunit